jgi:hypothetical protein
MTSPNTATIAAGIRLEDAPLLVALNTFFNPKANGITAVDINPTTGHAVLILSRNGENFGTSQCLQPVKDATKTLRQEVNGLDAHLKTFGL